MKIIPPCEIKKLSDCKAGELVRKIHYGNEGEFALVAVLPEKEKKALIVFSSVAIEFQISDNSEQDKVLSYGCEYELHIDQKGPFEAEATRMYNANGCIIRNGSRWLMNVHNSQFPISRGTTQYDLENGKLQGSDQDFSNIAVFGKWSIYIRTADTDNSKKILVASFEWKDKTA